MSRLSRVLPLVLMLALIALTIMTLPKTGHSQPVRKGQPVLAQNDDEDDDEGDGGEAPTESETRTAPKALDPDEEREGELPRKAELSPLPPVINQRNLNSCGACSFGYALTSYLVNKANGTDPSDPANCVSPAYMYHVALQNNSASECSYTRASNYFDFLVRYGAASQAEAPYPSGQKLDCNLITAIDTTPHQNYRKFQLGSWDQLSDAHDLDEIKGFIADEQPVVGLFEVYKGMHRVKKGDVYTPSGAKGGRHFMTIVGYDDDREYTDAEGESHKGAFRVMNSWGPQYADNGFLWIGYDAMKQVCNYAWTAEAVEDRKGDESGGEVAAEGGISGKVTKAFQATKDKHVDLIFQYQFSAPVMLEAVRVTAPGKHVLKEKGHGVAVRSADVYFRRTDGKQFEAGKYDIEFDVVSVDKEKATLKATCTVALKGNLPAAPPKPGETGTDGQPAEEEE